MRQTHQAVPHPGGGELTSRVGRKEGRSRGAATPPPPRWKRGGPTITPKGGAAFILRKGTTGWGERFRGHRREPLHQNPGGLSSPLKGLTPGLSSPGFLYGVLPGPETGRPTGDGAPQMAGRVGAELSRGHPPPSLSGRLVASVSQRPNTPQPPPPSETRRAAGVSFGPSGASETLDQGGGIDRAGSKQEGQHRTEAHPADPTHPPGPEGENV